MSDEIALRKLLRATEALEQIVDDLEAGNVRLEAALLPRPRPSLHVVEEDEDA